ncbi:MAG TPA: Npt1/Npt2 family nucleotide transporter [Candidatus Megaira endosymbiont of Hartmannula sinica]|nr:Npt1/Npt2 family nucleotide transporter [Candidatus Megaera endosymbiont of Hartmannula sinica]
MEWCFTKLYCVTPMAAFFVIFYAKIVNHLSFDKIFYSLITFFTSFFILFAFVIYPNIDFFQMDNNKLDALMQEYPHFKWYISIIGNWSYVIFYSLSELWPNIFYVLLFWQLANEITSSSEAKRFYTLFALFGNLSLIIVGFIMMGLSSDNSFLSRLFMTSDNKIMLVKVSTLFTLIFSIISCLLVRYISKNIIRPLLGKDLYLTAKSKKKQMGVIQSFKYIVKSRYLWLMLICSASFGLTMNLVEAVWKAKLKSLYPTVSGYAMVNSIYILLTGCVIVFMTLLGNKIMQRNRWFVSAVISPLVILITGTMFFILVIFDDYFTSFFNQILFIVTPLYLSVIVGAIQNILSKGTKYSIWDAARQMLYIPLDRELKVKGKAAVDILSPKIGKSASGFIQSLIFTVMPFVTYDSIAGFLMSVFIIVCILWIFAIREIGEEYENMIKNQKD